MPEISRFFGIVIRMYFDDHNPPHKFGYQRLLKSNPPTRRVAA
jgi:hypothetical protein